MHRRSTWHLTTALVAAASWAGASGAHAAGFELKEQSAIAQGASYAGAAARSDDPSTMFFNAASITKLPGYQVSAGLAGIFPQGNLASGTATTGGLFGYAPYAGVTGTNSGASAALPSFYGTAQVTDTVFLGLAITSPFGLTTKYPGNSIARYYALTTQLRTVNFGPTIAWQVTPQLSLGAGLNIETADAHLSNAVDYGAIGALKGLAKLGYLPGTKDGIATVRGNDTTVGWNVGLLFEPQPGTKIGFAYRSAMSHNLQGSITYQNVPTLLAPGFVNASASAKVPEPASASLSVAQDIGKWTALADVTFTGWSSFKTLTAYTGSTVVSTTPENFNNTVSLSVGADYRLNEQVTLRAGTMYDPTPVKNQFRTPRIADNDRIWLSIGATYKPIPSLALTGAYSHLFAANTNVNLADAGPGTPNFLRGNLNASYNLAIDIVSVQATYKF